MLCHAPRTQRVIKTSRILGSRANRARKTFVFIGSREHSCEQVIAKKALPQTVTVTPHTHVYLRGNYLTATYFGSYWRSNLILQ